MHKYIYGSFFPYNLKYLYEKSNTWPDAGVDVSDEVAAEYIQPPPHGKTLGSDNNGYPCWVDIKPPSLEEMAEIKRAMRDAELDASSWLVERHRDEVEHLTSTSLSSDNYSELQVYRQKLRDWPAQHDWPDIDMPPAPDWLAELKK